jgi:hypothetical protein
MGRWKLTATRNVGFRIQPIAGGAPSTVPGATLGECEYLKGWTGDGHLIVEKGCDVPGRVFRVSVQSGERTLWKELQPNDAAGVISIGRGRFTSDGMGCAFQYTRNVSSDLYLVEGLK